MQQEGECDQGGYSYYVSWKPWTPCRLVPTLRPEEIAKPSTVADAELLPGVTAPDLIMQGRRAALSMKPETTFQVQPTRMLVSIIMCCPHLLNTVQAVPFHETKTFSLFSSQISRLTLCYYSYAMQFLLKILNTWSCLMNNEHKSF